MHLDGAAESLLLFKADVLDTLAAAVEGCEGVFHVASTVPADKIVDPEASAHLSISLPVHGVALGNCSTEFWISVLPLTVDAEINLPSIPPVMYFM